MIANDKYYHLKSNITLAYNNYYDADTIHIFIWFPYKYIALLACPILFRFLASLTHAIFQSAENTTSFSIYCIPETCSFIVMSSQ